jgi:biopolymer transport protein ExbD
MKHGIMLSLVILITGCTGQVAPPVALPLARHAPAVIDRDPRAVQLTCTSDGALWLGNTLVSIDDLPAELQNRRHKGAGVPIAIRADRHMGISNLWGVLQVCCNQYDGRLALTVLREEPNIESEIVFTTPPLGDVGDVTPYVTLTRTPDGISMNGRAFQADALDLFLTRLASFSRNTSILLIPAPNDSVQDVAEIMDLCCKVGLTDIHVLEEGPRIEEIKDDAQPQGGGYSPPAAHPAQATP